MCPLFSIIPKVRDLKHQHVSCGAILKEAVRPGPRKEVQCGGGIVLDPSQN